MVGEGRYITSGGKASLSRRISLPYKFWMESFIETDIHGSIDWISFGWAICLQNGAARA
jgi:hypothetical protein